MSQLIVNAQELNISKSMINPDALYVIEKLQQNNFDAYVVGGGIRDLLLNKKPKDFDVVTNAPPEKVLRIFRNRAIIIGRRFKIVHINFENINPEKMINFRPRIEKHTIEVSTYRSSKVNTHNINEKGKITEDNNYGTQEEDAFRRDFTINSLYYDPIKEIIIDYTNGLKDLKKKSIRSIGKVNERYIEDPVRILRAIRLSKKLNFDIETETSKAIHKNKHLLANESKYRLYEEMLKVLLSGASIECILALERMKIPSNVFKIFDKLFFNKTPHPLIIKVLEKTDERIEDGDKASLVFIIAGLFWPTVNESWKKYKKNESSKCLALDMAIADNKKFILDSGVANSIFSGMREVWQNQNLIENPSIKLLERLNPSSKFRQAWYIYTIRNDLERLNSEIFIWWEKFINYNYDKSLLKELKNILKK